MSFQRCDNYYDIKSNERNVVYMRMSKRLTPFELQQLFSNIDESRLSYSAPSFPKGDEVFVYQPPVSDTESWTDWSYDGYRWYADGRKRMHQTGINEIFTRIDAIVQDRSREPNRSFQRAAYISDSGIVVQYIGNHTIPRFSPHEPHSPTTLPQKRRVADYSEPGPSYNAEPEYQSIPSQPKIRAQTQPASTYDQLNTVTIREDDDPENALYIIRERLSCIWTLQLQDNLVITIGREDALNLTRKILELPEAILTYDVTYQFMEGYITPLMINVPWLVDETTFPVAFLIHDTCNQWSHDIFFTDLKQKLGRLRNITSTMKIPIVLERKEDDINSGHHNIANTVQVCDWNLLRQDLSAFVVNQAFLSSEEAASYVEGLDLILHSTTPLDMERKTVQVLKQWTPQVSEYYTTYMRQAVESRGTICALRSLDVPIPERGIVLTRCEVVDKILKQISEKNELRIDRIVIALHSLQAYCVKTVLRSVDGSRKCRINPSCPPPSRSELPPIPQDEVPPSMIIKSAKAKTVILGPRIPQVVSGTNITPVAQARMALSKNQVTHIAQKATFMIDTVSEGEAVSMPIVVRLFPRELCSCRPDGYSCWHILACQMAIGMPIDSVACKL